MKMPKTLLIVDDEVDVCRLLCKRLSTKFNRVECAHTLSDGFSKAVLSNPDTILLDNNLPDGFGIHFISVFKTLINPVKIILISAMNLQQEALEAGADLFWEKPIILRQLEIFD